MTTRRNTPNIAYLNSRLIPTMNSWVPVQQYKGALVQKIVALAKAFGLALSGLIVAFALAWWILAQFNFSYGFWHGYGGMGEAIDRLAKTNVQKFGFENTTKAQRDELFREIMDAVHHGGRGLEEITYQVSGYPKQALLVEEEIVHLNDVANLVQLGFYLSLVAFGVWLGTWFFFLAKQLPPPSLKLQVVTTLGFIGVTTILVLIIGPIPVFYQLHIWLFPEGHQWFFYFDKSLMATLMFAPNLFGWIAVEWLALTLPLFLLLQTGAAYVVRRLVWRSPRKTR